MDPDMNEPEECPKSSSTPTWKLRSGWYLMVCTGGTYETDFVHGDHLIDAWEVACWGEIGGAPEALLHAAAARLADPDHWFHDGDDGPTRYEEAVGETDHLLFFRLPGFALVGALASNPHAPDPNPECPMQHVLHPSCAGADPVLLYATLPPHLAKLGR